MNISIRQPFPYKRDAWDASTSGLYFSPVMAGRDCWLSMLILSPFAGRRRMKHYLGKTMILQLSLVQASEQAKAEERRRGIVKVLRPAIADLVSCTLRYIST